MHPEASDLLIKVLHPHRGVVRGPLRRALHRLAGTTGSFLHRETQTLLRLQRGHRTALLPVARTGGFVQTDLGLGQLVERIGYRQSPLGPTLEELRRCGPLSDHELALLNDFIDRVYALGLVIRDLKTRNLVLGQDAAGLRFVLVDGLGDKNVIPVRSLISAWNRRTLDRDFARMAARLGLFWQERRMQRDDLQSAVFAC